MFNPWKTTPPSSRTPCASSFEATGPRPRPMRCWRARPRRRRWCNRRCGRSRCWDQAGGGWGQFRMGDSRGQHQKWWEKWGNIWKTGEDDGKNDGDGWSFHSAAKGKGSFSCCLGAVHFLFTGGAGSVVTVSFQSSAQKRRFSQEDN
jgi:hypothetical protein